MKKIRKKALHIIAHLIAWKNHHFSHEKNMHRFANLSNFVTKYISEAIGKKIAREVVKRW